MVSHNPHEILKLPLLEKSFGICVGISRKLAVGPNVFVLKTSNTIFCTLSLCILIDDIGKAPGWRCGLYISYFYVALGATCWRLKPQDLKCFKLFCIRIIRCTETFDHPAYKHVLFYFKVNIFSKYFTNLFVF